MQNQIRVLSVDDHPLVREGIAAVINSQPDMQVIAQASTGHEAIEYFRKYQPDVTVMDLMLPDMNGVEAMNAIHAKFPNARVMILTTYDSDNDIQRALEAGARSYIFKTMPPREIAAAIRQVHAGKKHIPPAVAAHLAEYFSDESLTDREVGVLRLVMGGNRNRDIADQLFIAEETVKAHIKHIMEKLGASDRTQAVAIGVRRGIIHI